MRPRIGQNDIALKVRTAERLLKEGDKMKVSVMFRGREMTHPEIGRELLERVLDMLKEIAVLEKPPSMEGRFLTMILAPNAKKSAQAASASSNSQPAGANGG